MRSLRNKDDATVAAFGDEWTRFDQSGLPAAEAERLFSRYFAIFDWCSLSPDAEGFDMGCGSGRWSVFVAPRVGRLNCIDASSDALAVARWKLEGSTNVSFIEASVDTMPLAEASQDFGYSLGVLHHVPDTAAALADCVRLLKPGAPFLVYLYYRFDNRRGWFRSIWKASDWARAVISRLPAASRHFATDAIAAGVYFPISRLVLLGERIGLPMRGMPLAFYRDASFYTMRTDSRDRFGTPLEQRFTRAEIATMMASAGLVDVRFLEDEPYWVACGIKRQVRRARDRGG